MRKYNDWESEIKGKYKLRRGYDLNEIYSHAHSELSLQQSKRDQLITVYLALCSFLIPFALGEKIQGWQAKGMIFLVVGVVGILFSMITARYREYKEIYWLCCQSISLLYNFDVDTMDKKLVQTIFYQSLHKRGKGYLRQKKNKLNFSRTTYVRKNLFSSETLYFAVIALMAACVTGLGVGLCLPLNHGLKILCGIGCGLLVFFIVACFYFAVGRKVYGLLGMEASEENLEKRDECFNKVFAKAWFLHFCYEEPNRSKK